MGAGQHQDPVDRAVGPPRARMPARRRRPGRCLRRARHDLGLAPGGRRRRPRRLDRPPEILSLFAYTGGATLACARAGARVAHVDASKPAVAWARRNAELSGLADRPVRWLVDDVRAVAPTRASPRAPLRRRRGRSRRRTATAPPRGRSRRTSGRSSTTSPRSSARARRSSCSAPTPRATTASASPRCVGSTSARRRQAPTCGSSRAAGTSSGSGAGRGRRLAEAVCEHGRRGRPRAQQHPQPARGGRGRPARPAGPRRGRADARSTASASSARALAGGARVVEVFVDRAGSAMTAARRSMRRAPPAPRSSTVAPFVLDRLAYGDRGDGIVAVARIPDASLDALVLPPDPLVVVVEGVEKPGNLGAVLRSADGAGADAVIAADPRTDLFNPNAVRASQGTRVRRPGRRRPIGGRARLAPRPRRPVLAATRRRRASLLGRRPPRAGGHRARQRGRPGSPMPGRATTSRRSGCRCSASPTASTSRSRRPSSCTRRGASATPRPGRLDAACRPSTSWSSAPAPPARAPRTRPASSARPSPSSTAAGSAARARTSAACRRRPAPRGGAPLDGVGLLVAARLGAPRLHGQPPRGRRRARRQLARRVARGATARSTFRGEGRITAPRASSTVTGDDGAVTESVRATSIVAVGSTSKVPPIEGLADTNPWTNERGDADPRAAEEPARPRRRPDRLRARPGLRAVRRPDDDRAVGPAPRPDRAPAQRRDRPLRPRARRGDGADRRRAVRARAGAGDRTARTSSTSTTGRPPRAT